MVYREGVSGVLRGVLVCISIVYRSELMVC